ncbi:MAG: dihydroxyacetone kinase subunit L [Spirochaetes bacterium]|nr:dihydroxyacetone kinase subunit L [Spirochaetota bacterium]
MTAITNEQGASILFDLIKAIQDHKQYLSDIDGAIGDGDHGINMNKGFTICKERLGKAPESLAHGFMILAGVLMTEIGGSLGPLYGTLFRSMAREIENVKDIDKIAFGRMMQCGKEKLAALSEARQGDKTIMDVIIPAERAYREAVEEDKSFAQCLEAMARAAREGRDATRDMAAAYGRASRLGERSRGVIDAGAASCCLILETMARSINEKLTSLAAGSNS